MAAKIVSFSRKMVTRQELAKEPLFIKAVKKAALIMAGEDSDAQVAIENKLATKRQAAKFFQGKGLVYETTNKEE
jgi:hypothetical protein